MSDLNQHDQHRRSLSLPREWIERRLTASEPDLTEEAISALHAKLHDLGDGRQTLNVPLNLSYVPNTLEGRAEAVGHGLEQLLESLRADFSQGVAVRATDSTTREGRRRVVLVGSRWKLRVRPQTGQKTGRTLAVIENVQHQDVPPRRPSFALPAIRFKPIWKESACDLEELADDYSRCLRELQAAGGEITKSISETHQRRSEASRAIHKELLKRMPDSDVRRRVGLHGTIRKHYSALRSMMDLLKLRTEQQKVHFDAQVRLLERGDPGPEAGGPGSPSDATAVQLILDDDSLSASVEERTVLEVERDDARPLRCRVLDTTRSDGHLAIEIDLDIALLADGASVRATVVPRFGLRAHQRALQDLLNENIDGYWPDLAQLLCQPDSLSFEADPPAPPFYFCDSDEDLPPLNARQRRAVTGALATPHAYAIQGPPGTGKTTVICELVQQLITRGERVLLAAPTHVAVDEVLRRIGTREGVRPLRLSWDEGKIAEDVRKYSPNNIIDPFIDRALSSDPGQTTQWAHEHAACLEAVRLIDALVAAEHRHETTTEALGSAEEEVNLSKRRLWDREPELLASIRSLEEKIEDQRSGLTALCSNLHAAEDALKCSRESAGVGGRILGILGFGKIGRRRSARRELQRRVSSGEGALTKLERQSAEANAELNDLRKRAGAASEHLRTCTSDLKGARGERDAARAACHAHALLQDIGTGGSELDDKRASLVARAERLKNYEHLRSRFDEMVAGAASSGTDHEGLRRDLLAISNLFCCTTTGIAGSKELRDASFDTLIVDEASRVTDAEFLIGAVRAKRWILVGDEHQLPPYVEQQDEHFLHALSALARAEVMAEPIDEAVSALGAMWEEDEELHKFRAQSVLRIARDLQQADDWDKHYRSAFRKAEKFISREHEDPSRALLAAMRNQMVHSLFEGIVAAVPPSLRVRLVEQRRMIAPLARIVSEPIYGGDYITPDESELAERGIVPLVTPTFPKPVTFLDTSALGVQARDELDGSSFINRVEAEWIGYACERLDSELRDMGSPPVSASVLTFYKAQARLVRERLFGDRQRRHRFTCLTFSVIDSIDRIQGQESDVVFLSFCRTAGRKVTPGFGQWLQDLRRVNVACTRAHRALILVGQKELLGRLCSNPDAQVFYAHLDRLFGEHADVMERKVQFGGGGK